MSAINVNKNNKKSNSIAALKMQFFLHMFDEKKKDTENFLKKSKRRNDDYDDEPESASMN